MTVTQYRARKHYTALAEEAMRFVKAKDHYESLLAEQKETTQPEG